MRFKLTYRGPLKSGNSKDRRFIHKLRRHFHPQLQRLWHHPPLNENLNLTTTDRSEGGAIIGLRQQIKAFSFVPLVPSVHGWNAIAELSILLLRPYPAGNLIGQGGDLDNRMKVLFDALRMPNEQEIGDSEVLPGEDPFYVLLEDDALITNVSVETDELLATVPMTDCMKFVNYVELVIDVTIRVTRTSIKNLGISG